MEIKENKEKEKSMNAMNTIERILDLIKKNNITARKLTEEAQLSSSAITEWKNGKANPSYGAIVKIAIYFNVNPDYLQCKTDDPLPADKKNGLSPEKLKLLDGIGYAYYGSEDKELDEEDVDTILEIVELTRKMKEKRNK